MSNQRLFVAVTPPAPVRAALAPLVEPLAGANWTPAEQWHVTLRFIGEVTPEQEGAVVSRLARVRVAPFLLPMEGVGSFPPKQPPRVLWIGVGSGHPRLFQLRQQLDDGLLAAGLQLDVRTFHPHLTLARVTDEGAPAAAHWLHAHRNFAGPPFRVEAFSLYASELRPGGAVHTLKHRFPLAD